MATLRRHTPSFIDDDGLDVFGANPDVFPFYTRRQLLAIPFVAAFAATREFSHFSGADECLVFHTKDGGHWVIGYADPPEALGLLAASDGPRYGPPAFALWAWLTYWVACSVIGHRLPPGGGACSRCGAK